MWSRYSTQVLLGLKISRFWTWQPLSCVIDKLGHTYLHMLVVCSRDLKIPGAHSHDLSYAVHPRYNPDSGICPQPQKSKLAFKHPCELQVPLCVFLQPGQVVAVLLPQHVPSLPSQCSWTAGSQSQDLVNCIQPTDTGTKLIPLADLNHIWVAQLTCCTPGCWSVHDLML